LDKKVKTTTKQKLKHKTSLPEPGIEPGPLAQQSGGLPLGHRDNWTY